MGSALVHPLSRTLTNQGMRSLCTPSELSYKGYIAISTFHIFSPYNLIMNGYGVISALDVFNLGEYRRRPHKFGGRGCTEAGLKCLFEEGGVRKQTFDRN
jgi:hypothetical protein